MNHKILLCRGWGDLFKAALRSIKEWADQDVEIDLCLIGTKASAFFNSVGGNVVASVRDLGEAPTVADLIGSVKAMLDGYDKGNIDKLYLVSNEFVNTMTQDPTVAQLLPLLPSEDKDLKHHWDYIYFNKFQCIKHK